jgi:hypothetical protein
MMQIQKMSGNILIKKKLLSTKKYFLKSNFVLKPLNRIIADVFNL